MPGQRVNIISVKPITSGDPARFGKKDTMVSYGVEGQGTTFLILASEAPTHEDIVAAVKAAVANRHPSTGASFEV